MKALELSRSPETIGLILFKVSGKLCALKVSQIQEVLPYATLLKPPGLPSVIEGFLNISGNMFPVIRLDSVLNLPQFPIGLYTPMLVLKGVERSVAFLAETVDRVIQIPGSAIHSIETRDSWNGCVLGEFEWNHESVALLSAEKMLLNQEQAAVQEHSMVTEERIRLLRLNEKGTAAS